MFKNPATPASSWGAVAPRPTRAPLPRGHHRAAGGGPERACTSMGAAGGSAGLPGWGKAGKLGLGCCRPRPAVAPSLFSAPSSFTAGAEQGQAAMPARPVSSPAASPGPALLLLASGRIFLPLQLGSRGRGVSTPCSGFRGPRVSPGAGAAERKALSLHAASRPRHAFTAVQRRPRVGLLKLPRLLKVVRSSQTCRFLYSARRASVRFPMHLGVSVTYQIGRSFLGNSEPW